MGKQDMVIAITATTLMRSGKRRPPKTGSAANIPATRLSTRAKRISSEEDGKGRSGNTESTLHYGYKRIYLAGKIAHVAHHPGEKDHHGNHYRNNFRSKS